MFLIILLIVAIIGLIVKNNNLSNEIINLKKMRFCPRCGFDLIYEKKEDNNIESNNNSSNETLIKEINQKEISFNFNNNNFLKNTYNDKEIKNNLILITGSILIIISSIIFLTSSWYIINNVVKTLIIILVLIVFLTSSYIADNYLNLKQTSNAFYYISLAYIPISLFAVALFQLFGKYFSIYGMGRFIYLTISSLVVTFIYYFCSNFKRSKLLCIASFIFGLLATVFFCLIFTSSTSVILLGLLVYCLFFNILYIKNKYYFDKEIHLKFITVLNISLAVLLGNNIVGYLFVRKIDIFDLISNLLLFLNLYLLLIKILKREYIYKFVYPILTILLFYCLALMFDSGFIVKQLLLLLSFILIYVYDILKYNYVTIGSFVEVSFSFIILSFNTFIYPIFSDGLFINEFILFIVFTALNYINYLYSSLNKKVISYIFTITLFLSFYGIFNYFSLPIIINSYITIIFIFLSIFIKRLEENMKNAFRIVGHLFTLGLTFINLFIILNSKLFMFFLLIYGIFCYIYGYRKNNSCYRIISYMCLNISIISLLTILDIDNFKYIPAITTMLVYLLESIMSPEDRENNIKWYLIFQFIVSYIILILDYDLASFIILILLNSLFAYFIKMYKLSNNYVYLVTLCLIPYIYDSSILVINGFNYMYFISIAVIMSNLFFTHKKKTNLYIITFYIYTICHMIFLEEIKYISLGLLIFGTYIICRIKINKARDIFKILLYTLVLILCNFIISDLKMNCIALLNYGIYIIYLLLITRSVLNKYLNNYKLLEYMVSSFIYLIALFNYTNELDGIIFVSYLVLVVIVCYLYKFGPVFLVSLLSILFNVFVLTRSFWVIIPWWIYILLLGTILVSFSVYNEIKLKEDKKIKSKFIKLKNDLDI